MASLLDRFRRKPPSQLAIKQNPEPSLFYLGGDGRMQAVKSGSFITTSTIGRVGLGYVVQHAEQYARAAVASVWAANCINLRADTIARLDWHVRNKRTLDIVNNHIFTQALEISQQNIMRRLEWTQLIWGETFIKPLRNENGWGRKLFVLNNLDVTVDDSMGYITRIYYNPQGAHKQHIYSIDEIVFLKTDNPFDDHRGLSRFEHVMLEIDIDRDISRTTRAFYANDARPGLLLIPSMDLTDSQREEFIAYWNSQFQGPNKAGKTVLAPTSLKDIKEFQRAPSIDDVELRESVRREICAAFKVPLSMAGAWDDATYQSLPEQRKAFYEETIIPAAEFHARELTRHALPFFEDDPDYEVYFNPDAIMSLVEDSSLKVDLATKKLQSGAYTINEIRTELGDDLIKGGDIHIMQSGWLPVRSKELATFEAPNMAPAPEAPALPAGNPPEQIPAQASSLEPTRHDHTHDHSPVLYVPDETVAVKTIHEEALQEVRAWQKFYANGTANKRPFKAYMIREDIADELQAQLDSIGADSDAIKAAFKQVEKLVVIKTSDAVRASFEVDIRMLITAARQGTLRQSEFGERMKGLLRRYGGLAYRAGLSDGGVIVESNEPLDTEDAAIYEGMYAEQVSYVGALASAIYSAGISDAQAAIKPQQWFGKSVQPFYDAGLLSSARNQMVEYVGPIDSNSCDSCKALVGQRHRRRDFAAAGMMPPYGSNIICSDGGLCKHRVIAVNGRARGNLSRVPRR